MKKYGEIIAKLRKERGLTQEQLGKRLNVSYQAVSKWENNLSEPDLETIEKLAEIFGISLADFFLLANNSENTQNNNGQNNADKNKIGNVQNGSNSSNANAQSDTNMQSGGALNSNSPSGGASGGNAQNVAAPAVDITQDGGFTSGAAYSPGAQNNTPFNTEYTRQDSRFVAFIKTKPWYLVAGLAVLIVILSLCAFLIPIKYASGKIYNMVDPAVFCITAEGASDKRAGTGFFINNSGLAVTNYHVIEGCTSGKVQLNNGQIFDIKKVVGCDEARDIAILQIDIARSNYVKLGNSDRISVGDTVYAIGYPESFVLGSADSTFTQGIISKTSYTHEGNTYIQTTVDMTHGNSGGVLLNERGQVIGITSAMLTDGLVNYMNMAIPINKINEVPRDINVPMKEYHEMHKVFRFFSAGYVISSQKFMSGDKIAEIDTPTRTGYTFGGWFIEDTFDTEFDFDSPVTDQTACYAKWYPISYKIKFSGTGLEEEYYGPDYYQEFVYDVPQKLKKCQFVNPGYDFLHWSYNSQKYADEVEVERLTATQNGVVEFVAVWKSFEYQIRFDAGGGSGAMPNYTTACNGVDTLPAARFTKEGYAFAGWRFGEQIFADEANFSDLTQTQKEVVLTATWRPIKYIVHFHSPRFDIDKEATFDIEFTLLNLNEPENSSYLPMHNKLKSWRRDSDGAIFAPDAAVINLANTEGASVRFEAVWEEIDYFVDFISEETDETETKKCKYSVEYDFATTLVNEGYYASKFQDVETEKQYSAGIKFNRLCQNDGDRIQYKIVWQEVVYSIRYMVDNVEYASCDAQYFTEYAAQDYTDTKTGYNFAHWQLGDRQIQPQEMLSGLTNKNGETVVLNAVFVPIKFKIKFDANGGRYYRDEVEVEYNSELKFNYNNNPTRAEHTFLGWACGARCLPINVASITCVQTAIENDTVVLRAIWSNDFASGDGTAGNPYLIGTPSQLQSLSRSQGSGSFAYYKLSNDIDMQGEGHCFKYGAVFNGVLDGGGYKIHNTKVNGPLFYEISKNSTIKNLILEDVTCIGIEVDFSSGFVNFAPLAVNNRGTVQNVHIKNYNHTGSKGTQNIAISFAGFVGGNYGEIDGCSVQNATGFWIGYPHANMYLAGFAISNIGKITNSYSNGVDIDYDDSGFDIKYSYWVLDMALAGFVGTNIGQIESCYANNYMNVKIKRLNEGPVYVGGFVANSIEGSIKNCFTVGDIEYSAPSTSFDIVMNMSKFAFFSTEAVAVDNLYVNSSANMIFDYQEIQYNSKRNLDTNYLEADFANFVDENWLKANIFTANSSMWIFSADTLPILRENV